MPIGRFGGAARRVLPFGLGQQAVGLAGLLGQPADELLGIVPRHVDDGALAAAPVVVVGLVRAAVLGHARIPLREGHLIFAGRERLREGHLALRAFVRIAAPLARRRSHHELAGRHHDHLRTGCAVAEHILGAGGLAGSAALLLGLCSRQLEQEQKDEGNHHPQSRVHSSALPAITLEGDELDRMLASRMQNREPEDVPLPVACTASFLRQQAPLGQRPRLQVGRGKGMLEQDCSRR